MAKSKVVRERIPIENVEGWMPIRVRHIRNRRLAGLLKDDYDSGTDPWPYPWGARTEYLRQSKARLRVDLR